MRNEKMTKEILEAGGCPVLHSADLSDMVDWRKERQRVFGIFAEKQSFLGGIPGKVEKGRFEREITCSRIDPENPHKRGLCSLDTSSSGCPVAL